MEKLHYPGWRTALFLPVHIEKFVTKAHTRGADAYILDMEDSVPLDQKKHARSCIKPAAKTLADNGVSVLVRINPEDDLAPLDVKEAVCQEVQTIVVPKVETAVQILRLAELIDIEERAQGIKRGHTSMIAMIESVSALPYLDEIAAAHPRVVGMILGSEDFSATAGMKPTTDTLVMPNQMLAFACRRANIAPLGFPGSIADYHDLDRFADTIRFAKDLGFVGAFCIHPSQVTVINDCLSPNEEDIADAEGLIACYEQGIAEGKGAVQYKGKMIDLPVVQRAKELLDQAKALSS